jgi:hypothetical protein
MARIQIVIIYADGRRTLAESFDEVQGIPVEYKQPIASQCDLPAGLKTASQIAANVLQERVFRLTQVVLSASSPTRYRAFYAEIEPAKDSRRQDAPLDNLNYVT